MFPVCLIIKFAFNGKEHFIIILTTIYNKKKLLKKCGQSEYNLTTEM